MSPFPRLQCRVATLYRVHHHPPSIEPGQATFLIDGLSGAVVSQVAQTMVESSKPLRVNELFSLLKDAGLLKFLNNLVHKRCELPAVILKSILDSSLNRTCTERGSA